MKKKKKNLFEHFRRRRQYERESRKCSKMRQRRKAKVQDNGEVEKEEEEEEEGENFVPPEKFSVSAVFLACRSFREGLSARAAATASDAVYSLPFTEKEDWVAATFCTRRHLQRQSMKLGTVAAFVRRVTLPMQRDTRSI